MTRLSHEQMAEQIALIISAKQNWMAKFTRGKDRRPDWNIRQQQDQLRVLQQAYDDYRRAADRSAA